MKDKIYQRGRLVAIRKTPGGPSDRPLIRGPCSRVIMPSRKIAERAMREMARKDRLTGRDPVTLNIYWCPRCDAWHVGNRPAGGGESGPRIA